MKFVPFLPTSVVLAFMAASVLDAPAEAAPVCYPRHSLATRHRRIASAASSKIQATRRLAARRLAAKKPVTAKPAASKPLSHPGLGRNPTPRRPTTVAATGRANPDARSDSLADERLRDNALAPEMTLEDALVLTLANNPRRRQAQSAVDAATAQIGATGAAGKLQVGVSGSTQYGRNTDASNAAASAIANRSASSDDGTGGRYWRRWWDGKRWKRRRLIRCRAQSRFYSQRFTEP